MSLGLVVVGIVVSAWAVANIIASPSPDAAPRPVHAPIEPPRASEPTEAAEVSSAPEPEPIVYAADPAVGELLGTLTIPALGQSFTVVEGTGAAELKQGVGHMLDTAMPGEPDNCVISGHRDTVFSQLGSLKEGDLLVMETATGAHTYKISGIRIVHKDDRTVVVPTDHAVLTVSTCYPFRYVGAAPDRYVLSADLVESK